MIKVMDIRAMTCFKQSNFMKKLTSLAYYLPQFHEIPENNAWWGKSFTEWSNLNVAETYYSWQEIRTPVEPYFEYDLLNIDVLKWQQNLSEEHGITGFFMWDYWFGDGKRLLEKPSELILKTGIKFKYCFSWANHSWQNKRTKTILMPQKYLGRNDYVKYFYKNLRHFVTENYIKIDGKPVFGIFAPKDIPDLNEFITTFRELAIKEGFPGIYMIADNAGELREDALALFDRYMESSAAFKKRKFSNPMNFVKEQLIRRANLNWLGPVVYDYDRTILSHSKSSHLKQTEVPVLFTGWDTTPRHKTRGTIFKGFSVPIFKENLRFIGRQLAEQGSQTPLLVIKSWNEWAEGNVMEPDNIFQKSLLDSYESWLAEGNPSANPQ